MRLPSWLLLGALPLATMANTPPAAATPSDSSYVNADLSASTLPPWNPAEPVRAARPWETALRLPGRIVSLPLVGLGKLGERSMLYVEKTNSLNTALFDTQRFKEMGILVLPASLGDHTGLAGELVWSPLRLDQRILLDASASTSHYNRERITAFVGPFGVAYTSEWRPRELYFGPGLDAPESGKSSYGEQSQAAKLILYAGWQRFDSLTTQKAEPLMFHDRVRVRGPMHRTWVSAWAGPREVSVTTGRDPQVPSFEIAHPDEAASSLHQRVEHFVYGAGLSHDARWGRPHWSGGWRASVESERYQRSIGGLAFNDAGSDAQSFTRTTYHAETATSFRRDPHTVRLSVTAVDQYFDRTGGTFLLSDLQTLGGSAGLAGYEYGRFRDSDLVLTKLAYIFPLVKNAEFELHAESGGVFPGLLRASVADFKNSFGLALRFRTEDAMFGAVGCDWSREALRFRFSFGGN